MDKIKLLILPGDGIGPEAVDEVKKIIDFLNKKNFFSIVSSFIGTLFLYRYLIL